MFDPQTLEAVFSTGAIEDILPRILWIYPHMERRYLLGGPAEKAEVIALGQALDQKLSPFLGQF
jgi:hypothetical protein